MITESEARIWYGDYHKIACGCVTDFIKVGKENGCIKLSTLEEARVYYEKCKTPVNKSAGDVYLWNGDTAHLVELYEKTISELLDKEKSE